MIFLTIGSHEPFDRLVRVVDAWAGQSKAEVFGQITERASYQPVNFPATANLDPVEYQARCAQADFLVAHAGMGSILTALQLGKPIVVLPRRGHLKETRNDHQYATAERFGSRPGITVALSEDALPAALDKVLSKTSEFAATPISSTADASLIAALRKMIHPTES